MKSMYRKELVLKAKDKKKDAKSSHQTSKFNIKQRRESNLQDIRKYLNVMSPENSLIVKTSNTSKIGESRGDQESGERRPQKVSRNPS